MPHSLPISDYYSEGVIDFWTISNSGGWWTVAVYHVDPKTEKKQISLYRWQRRKGEWKNAGCVRINSKEKLLKLVSALDKVQLD